MIFFLWGTLCKVCHKRFKQLLSLTLHEAIHTGDYPHRCDTYDKGFTLKGNLDVHQDVHTGDKPYKYNDKGFTTKASLEKHLRIHRGDKPYNCNTCDNRFAQKGILEQHK